MKKTLTIMCLGRPSLGLWACHYAHNPETGAGSWKFQQKPNATSRKRDCKISFRFLSMGRRPEPALSERLLAIRPLVQG